MTTRRSASSNVLAGTISIAALALNLIGPGSLRADQVIVESRDPNGILTPDPPYAEVSGGWFASSGKSRAAGLTGQGSRFGYALGPENEPPTFKVTPTLANPGGRYSVDITHVATDNIPVDLPTTVNVLGGSGLPVTTDVFGSGGANTWENIGTLILDDGVTMPEITFTYAAAEDPSFSRRFYADAVRFTSIDDPCLEGLPLLDTVNGPLAASQTYVIVPNVHSNATAVIVYADDVEIGRKSADVTPGTNVVTTAPLVKGQVITATQMDNQVPSIESCRAPSGPVVGGGANPTLKIVLSIRQDLTLTGPIGTNGGTATAPIKLLGTDGTIAGFGTAPFDGTYVQPSRCWQTVSFLRGIDPENPVDLTYMWSGTDPDHGNLLYGDFGILESIALAIDDQNPDPGPYRVYIDNLMNGSVLIEDFESAAPGTAEFVFRQPNFSGTTSPFLLAQPPGNYSPNIARVTDEQADTGSHSALVSWQFKDAKVVNWVRLATQGSGTPNPVVDLRLPISFRILVLPVGETESDLSVPVAPIDQAVCVGDPVTFSVTASGPGSFAYQWKKDGQNIFGENGDTYVIPSVQFGDFGDYSVEVSNASCSVVTPPAALTEATAPGPISISREGQNVVVSWQGSCFTLQQAEAIDGVFGDLPGVTSPYSVTVTPWSTLFFRLKL